MTHAYFTSDGKLQVPTEEELTLADGEVEIICFSEGIKEDQQPYWAYVAIRPSEYARFREAIKARQPIILSELGRIVYSGLGTQVPAEIRTRMQELYNYSDTYLQDLTRQLKQDHTTFMQQKEEARLMDIVALLRTKQQQS